MQQVSADDTGRERAGEARRTHPSGFRNPHSGRNKLARLLWIFAYRLLFWPTPSRFLVGWRNWLLRRFGAKLGRGVWLHPSVRIWAPWLVELGDDVHIDEQVFLYSAFGIRIGDRVIVSLRSFLCTASHDHEDPRYRLIGGPIAVESDCWIAGEAFLGPGIRVGEGSVIGARAVVTRDVEPWSVVAGNPARVVKRRELRDEGSTSSGSPP